MIAKRKNSKEYFRTVRYPGLKGQKGERGYKGNTGVPGDSRDGKPGNSKKILFMYFFFHI